AADSMGTKDAKALIHSAGEGFFIGVTPSGHAQVIETDTERASAATPMELLLIALGGCTAVDVASILKKKRERVSDYRVEVRGFRREEHPRAFTRIEVRHLVRGRGIKESSVAEAVELSETKYCSVAATLRPGVELVTTYEVVEEAGD
ncbi:MAG TPA: OsmC family protein, partial [Pyrinomonadaceae bacterium]|nr:OsmC family protein [Pyrinomonadaceae bacterium]